MKRIPLPDAKRALELYYSVPEIGNKEIKYLFGCGDTTAAKLKRAAKKKMIELGKNSWYPANVNIKIAYQAWNIDVSELEQNQKKLAELKKLGILN